MEPDALSQNKLILAALLLGLTLVGLGVLGFKAFRFNSGPKVEILDEPSLTEDTTIKVEIAGEIIKPGVYELESGSRVNDLLTLTGGLGAKADRDWVAKNINLAAKLTDGGKIYIPAVSEKSPNLSNSSNSSSKVNLNTASVAELDRLWGVGEATAQKIIEGRPYQRPEELLEKKIVNKNVWDKIKDQISLY